MKTTVTLVVKFICTLSAIIVLGCESADVGTGASSDDNIGDTKHPTEIVTIDVNPASVVITDLSKFTLRTIDPASGYTYTWSISEPTIGRITKTSNSSASYFPTSIPSAGTRDQQITVVGVLTSSYIKYVGSSTITHKAP